MYHHVFLLFFFFGKLAYLLLVAIESVLLFFFSQLDSLYLVCTIKTQSNINIVKENYNLQTLIFALNLFHYSHIFNKNHYKCFVPLTSVIVIQKNDVFFTKTNGYAKKQERSVT